MKSLKTTNTDRIYDITTVRGLGTVPPKNMMLPFLNSLVGILTRGPGISGRFANRSTYSLPNLIVAFANDGQLNEMASAVVVLDDQAPLSGT